MTYPLVSLALEYHRDPLAFRHLGEVRRPLPEGFEDLFSDFCAALSPARIAETAEQLGVDTETLEEAARFLVRHVLLHPEADHYRCLGLNRDAGPEAIRRHYQWLIRMFHPDRAEAATEFGALQATRLNLAYRTLHEPHTRQEYDRTLPVYQTHETPRTWFFQAQRPLILFEPSGSTGADGWSGRRLRLRYGLGVFLVSLATILALLSAMTNPKPPLALETHRVAEQPDIAPGYLLGAPSATPAAAPAPLSPERRRELIALIAGTTPPPSPDADSNPDSAPVATVEVEPKPEPRLPSPPPTATSPAPPPTPLPEALPKRQPEPPPAPLLKPSPTPPSGPASAIAPSPPAPRPSPAKIAPVVPKPSAEPAPAPKPAPLNPEQAARTLVDRLQSVYRRRNATAFAALFTRQARVNEGQGRSLIRDKYADLFRRTTETRLDISALTWRRRSEDRLNGSGSFTVSTRYQGSERLHRARGRIDFVVVRDGQDYRIASMIYRIE